MTNAVEVNICPTCGAEIASRFCPYCGTDVRKAIEEAAAAAAATQEFEDPVIEATEPVVDETVVEFTEPVVEADDTAVFDVEVPEMPDKPAEPELTTAEVGLRPAGDLDSDPGVVEVTPDPKPAYDEGVVEIEVPAASSGYGQYREPHSVPPQPPQPPQKKSKTGLIVGVIAGVLILALIISIISGVNKYKKDKGDPEDVIEQMEDDATEDALEEAEEEDSLLTNPGTSNSSYDLVMTKMQELATVLGRTVEFEGKTVDGAFVYEVILDGQNSKVYYSPLFESADSDTDTANILVKLSEVDELGSNAFVIACGALVAAYSPEVGGFADAVDFFNEILQDAGSNGGQAHEFIGDKVYLVQLDYGDGYSVFATNI